MESDRLNRWLTLGANLGVLIGLALLIVEIQQNNVLTLAQIEQSRSLSLIDWRRQAALDSDFAEVYARFRGLSKSDNPKADFAEQFTPAEKAQLNFMVSADFYDMENVFAQYERGLISEAYWKERIVPAIRGRAQMWKDITSLMEDGGARQAFKNEVERILQDAGEAQSP